MIVPEIYLIMRRKGRVAAAIAEKNMKCLHPFSSSFVLTYECTVIYGDYINLYSENSDETHPYTYRSE